jgi:hypothetical protein
MDIDLPEFLLLVFAFFAVIYAENHFFGSVRRRH